MAAVSDSSHVPHLVELRHLRAQDLNLLLTEEAASWKDILDWDFQASAGLVRRFLDIQALSGYSLVVNNRVVGYSYFVCEERKGLIGDLYLINEYATAENEGLLLSAVLDLLLKTPLVRRVESQLMMLRNAASIPLPHWRFLRAYRRNFMELVLGSAHRLQPADASRWSIIDNWMEFRHDEAAALIANAYQGHIDSDINDQYRSVAGAQRFLMNIVQYPGCGTFFAPASFVAVDGHTGRLCGICLTSLVAPDVGHITQVCVSKAVRGKGVGYQLMKQSLEALARHNCRKASLTVTAVNTEAIVLYERLGFKKVREFSAHVWEGF